MIIDGNTHAALLNTNDHPSVRCRKYCSISQLSLPLILAVLMKAKKCHCLLHLKHFSPSLLQTWEGYPAPFQGCLPLLWNIPVGAWHLGLFSTCILVWLTHHSQALSFKLKLASCVWTWPFWCEICLKLIFTPLQERCLNSIIEELRRRFWIQWHKLEGKPSCWVAK